MPSDAFDGQLSRPADERQRRRRAQPRARPRDPAGRARFHLAPATVDGRVYLRVCFTNFRTTAEDVVEVLTVARELGRPPGRDPVAPDPRPRERRQGSRASARNRRVLGQSSGRRCFGAGDVRGDGGVTGVTRHGFDAPLISRTGVIHRGALSVGTRSSDEGPRKARGRASTVERVGPCTWKARRSVRKRPSSALVWPSPSTDRATSRLARGAAAGDRGHPQAAVTRAARNAPRRRRWQG